jgi:hypothetical protein
MGMSDRSIKITPRYYPKLFLFAILVVLVILLIVISLGNSSIDLTDFRFGFSAVMVGLLFIALIATVITERNKVLLMVSKDMDEVVDTIQDLLIRNSVQFETERKEVPILGRVVKVRLKEKNYRIKITENITHDLYIYFQPVKTLKVGGRFIEDTLMECIKALDDIK